MFTPLPQDFVDESWSEWRKAKRQMDSASVVECEQFPQGILPRLPSSSSSSVVQERPCFYADAEPSAAVTVRKGQVVADGVSFF